MERKKELKELYKQMKPEMGVFAVKCTVNNKYYMESSPNLKGRINSTVFKLNAKIHPNKELQEDWNRYGEDRFNISIIDTLKYSEDETKTDYREDLALLKEVWEEKMSKENIKFYNL